ncbi:MAG: hypothetical protein NZT92_10640 [Abditibacteriales bacterium]|nr:hypothetical protein [Abditibacteriales bacterium]MDW8364782.1 hypothetical protein [Abditibacteriales bacterium]
MMPEKEVSAPNDPFMEGRYKISEFRIILIALAVIALVALAITWYTRRKPPPALPPATAKQPSYTVGAYHTAPYKIKRLRVKYLGQAEQFGERYDHYEVKGVIVRPTEEAASSARLFITLKSGLLTVKKVQTVVSGLEVAKEKEFTVRVPDETYARVRNATLDFIVMADQERPKTPLP